MTDAPILSRQQGNDVAAAPDGYAHITNPLNPLARAGSRLAHFTDGVYNLEAESHIVRLLKAFLGEAGVGGLQRAMLLVRLQQAMAGTHFFDLDAFYGAIFGARRALGEHLDVDPVAQDLPQERWDEIQIIDGSYRSRVARLSAAIHRGATSLGIEQVAEALTGIEFDVVESWMHPEYNQHSWDDWEGGSWDDMEAYTWDELERSPSATSEAHRNIITLYPYRKMTAGERFDLERALDRIRPANVIVVVSDSDPDEQVEPIEFVATADSTRWEIRQRVQNVRINGALPFPDEPEDEWVEPPVSAWSDYTGEAWTVLDRSPRILAYYINGTPSLDSRVDPLAVEMPPQALIAARGNTQPVSLPEFVLKPVTGLYAGRAASDGVVSANPYAGRSSDARLKIDRMDADFLSEHMALSATTGTRFWTTPIRPYDDATSEIIEVRFDEGVVVNHVSFQYARFPCTITLQSWDAVSGAWVQHGVVSVTESSPYGIPTSPPPGAMHPFHFGGDHWAKASFSIDATQAQSWRVVMVRGRGAGPVGAAGTRLPYPLGLRDLDMGYRVSSVRTVPVGSPDSPSGSSKNIIGLPTRFDLRTFAAANVSDGLPTSWVCEPQPIRDGVVNLYLRFQERNPQQVSQLYLDPTHHGVVMNLYYTSSAPVGTSSGAPLSEILFPVSVKGAVSGAASDTSRGLRLGAGTPAWVDIDIAPLGGATGPIWLGREYVVERLSDLFPSSGIEGVAIDAITANESTVLVMHGVIEGDDDLHYWVQVSHNGEVARAYWPSGDPPAEGSILRLAIEIPESGAPIILGSVNGGALIDSRTWPDGLTGIEAPTIASGQWDRSLHFLPPDLYESQAGELEGNFLARGSVTGESWTNLGSAGRSIRLTTTECWKSGHSDDIDTLAYLVFSGDAGHYLSAAHDTDLNIATDMTLSTVVLPKSLTPAAEEWIVSKIDGNTGYGLSVSPLGRAVLSVGTGAAVQTYTSTVSIPTIGKPVAISVAFDASGSTARFWVDATGSGWLQLGDDVTDAAVAAVDTNTGDLLIGAKNDVDGAFTGSIRSVIVSDGIDADMSPLGGTPVFSFTTPIAIASGGEIEVLDGSGAHVVTIVDGGTGLSVSAAYGPVVVANQASSYLSLSDTSIGNLTNSFALAGAAEVSIARLPTGGDMAPLFAKKGGFDASFPGWGFYVDSSGDVHFVISDGTTQQDEVPATTPTLSALSGPVCLGFSPHGSEITAVAYMRNGESLGSVSITRSAVADYTTSTPVRVLADGAVRTLGLVSRASVGSLGVPVGDDPFEQIAASMAGSPTYPLGSNWTVVRSALLDDSTTTVTGDRIRVAEGDVVFATNGYTAGGRNFWAAPAHVERFGSPMTTDCKLRLTAAADGYGSSPGALFLASPEPYCDTPVSGPTEAMAGEFLRFHPKYIEWSSAARSSLGFIGGVPDPWESAEWAPIGQFVVSKGTIEFPEVSAMALKMELTGLAPEPYEAFLPIRRLVKRFRTTINGDVGRQISGLENSIMALHSTGRFPDSQTVYRIAQDRRVNYVSPTSGLVLVDESVRDQAITRYGSTFAFAQWQPTFTAPIQPDSGPHNYLSSIIQAEGRVAFFAGFREVTPRRRTHRAVGDTKVYHDSFGDASNVDVLATTFEIETGQLFTPEGPTSNLLDTPRVAVSKPFASRTSVKALQFATQQTDPVQLVPDDEFRSPSLVSYAFDQESSWHASGDGIVFWDQGVGAVRISRNPGVLDAFYTPDTPIVHPPVTPVFSSGYVHVVSLDTGSSGGIISPVVSAAPRGVLYAACRVTAWNDLSADLVLRIYGSDGITVLAEKAFRPKVGAASEVILPYVLGTQPLVDTGVGVAVEQDGPYTDSWVMSSLSLFDSSIVWEFSVDGGLTWTPGHLANGSQYGVVQFPEPGSSLVWRVTSYRHNNVIDAIRIRPWYHRRLGAAL